MRRATRARRRSAVLIACAVVLAAGTVVSEDVRAHEGHESGPHPSPTAPVASRARSTGKATSVPAPAGAPAKDAPAPVVFRIRSGARADLGWTGIAHGQTWPAEQRLGFALDCSAGGADCPAVGGASGDFFGAPVPLSSGGVPACIVNRLRSSVAGRVQPKTGCGELELHLTATIFLGESVTHPCPTCREDKTPNDGLRQGRCDSGAATSRACDAQGASSFFGATSNDCLPVDGKNSGELPIDLAPFTTGTASLHASIPCNAKPGKDAARCFCAGQLQANACNGDRCAADGRCADGPVDGVCSQAPYRSCRAGSTREDCEQLFAGSGECVTSLRPCFGDTLTATGRCDPKTPTYVAVFCTPQTRAEALNNSTGLPGPARLVLPLERVRSPRISHVLTPLPAPATRSLASRSAAPAGLSACGER